MNYLAGVILTMTLFAIFALGLSLTYGQTGLINFGQVAFMGIGGYAAALVSPGLGLSWWGAVPIALVASAAFALLLGLPTLRLREDYLAIVTIGAAEILRTVWLSEDGWTRGPLGLTGYPRPFLGAMGGDPDRPGSAAWLAFADAVGVQPYGLFLLVLSLVTLGLAFLLLERLRRSPWGRVLKAIRDDEDAAAALGKNVFRFKLQSLILGGALGAVMGVLAAWYIPVVTPYRFLPIITFYAWVIIILGGATTHLGAAAGSVLLWAIFEGVRFMPAAATFGFTGNAGAGQVALVGLLLVLLLRFRPQGLFGNVEELKHAK